MFVFEEKFSCWDDACKPYGIRIESSSNLWHKHARAATDGYIVYCTGNKYLLEMPDNAEWLGEISSISEYPDQELECSFSNQGMNIYKWESEGTDYIGVPVSYHQAFAIPMK